MNIKVVLFLVFSAPSAFTGTTQATNSSANSTDTTLSLPTNLTFPSRNNISSSIPATAPYWYTVLQSEHREVSRIDISFKQGPSTLSPPVFDVYLGDRFYMFITYTGESHVIRPEKCQAYPGVVIEESTENITLWDKNSCSSTNILMDNFTQKNPQVLQAPLYGFHFYTSPYVTIECTVRICRPNTTCADTPICGKKRKKRRRKVLSALGSSSFQILDGNRISGGTDTINLLHRFTLCCMLVLTVFTKTLCI